MFLLNSRPGLFSAAPRRSGSKFLHPQGHPFSRSYGVKLPSSLTRDHSITLGRLPQPTSVGLRYGHRPSSAARLFWPAWAQPSRFDRSLYFPRPLSLTREGICLSPDAYGTGTRHVQWARSTYPPGSPRSLKRIGRWCRNNNRLSIAIRYYP